MTMINHTFFSRIRVRVAQFTFLLLLLYFMATPVAVSPLTTTKGAIGALIMLFGTLIRSLSAGAIHKNRFLASTGLYALTRNPLYLGSFILLVGLNTIVWDILFAIVTFTVFILTYLPTIRQEEEELAAAFPNHWAEFKRTTPRFFPAVWRLSAYTDIRWDYTQWRRNREYQTLITVVGLLITLDIYARFA